VLVSRKMPTSRAGRGKPDHLSEHRPVGRAYLVEATYSGSIAKGTANSCSTDMDIFISLNAQTPETLKEVFGKLHGAAQGWGWNPPCRVKRALERGCSAPATGHP
jgi:hypothetical protein